MSFISLCFFPTTFLIWIPTLAIAFSTYSFGRRFNGGSDSVAFIISLSLAIAFQFFRSHAEHVSSILNFIAATGVFSYFAAGLGKLRNPQWHSGRTLLWSLKQSCFQDGVVVIPSHLLKLISSVVIAWECLFPLALFNSYLAVFFCASGLFFHLAMSWSLGLNRFTFAWACFYPAIYFTSL